MNSVLKNTLLSVCAIGLLAGCASKDVEYDDQSVVAEPVTNVDNKIDKVAGTYDDQASSSMNNESRNSSNYANGSSSLQKITNSSVNNVQSDINGNVVLLESVHFPFDKYKLSDEMREISTSNYTKIDETAQNYSNLKIKLEGNCDEWGSDEYNYALGLKRAKATKDALIADGIDESKIVMVSFGESNPVCTQRNTNCWKMNRRVDYRLLP